MARTYRREAKKRARYPALADHLDAWADASLARSEQMRVGPLFGCREGVTLEREVFEARQPKHVYAGNRKVRRAQAKKDPTP